MENKEQDNPRCMEEKSIELSHSGTSNLHNSKSQNEADQMADSLTEDGIALINDQLMK